MRPPCSPSLAPAPVHGAAPLGGAAAPRGSAPLAARTPWALAAWLLAAGCAVDPLPEAPLPDAGTDPLADGVAIDPATPLTGRPLRRMDLDQLASSIEVATGGLRWTEVRDGVEVDLFTEVAATLGKPDFINITEEDLTPSLMFQKFLDDAAVDVCTRLVDRDAALPAADRVFMQAVERGDTMATNGDGVRASLSAALLRFHGRGVPADDPRLEPWTWLFDTSLQASGDTDRAWRTVCVGLLTHPDFYSY